MIRALLRGEGATHVVSGACHLGGIDAWAIEEAQSRDLPFTEYAPSRLTWSGRGGFMERNLQIAAASDLVASIVVVRLPAAYRGMRFPLCYHCKTTAHVKSGGCWTAHQAAARGHRAVWIPIPNEE